MDTLEAANSMSDMEVNDEHESFILVEPQDTCSFEEIPSPPAINTYAESNHLMPLYQKISKGWLWMILSIINIANIVVVCCVNLAARYHELNPKTCDGGSHNTKLAATSRRGSQGRAFDHKQALPGGKPYFFQFSKKNHFYFKKKMVK